MSFRIDPITFGAFVVVLALVALSGVIAARWHRGGHGGLEEWGLGGRQFGTLVTWFLVGGDFYTAYTIIAVPALVFATGASGFFALPYTIIVYPFVFLTMPRLWSVCRIHCLVTPADFVRARYGSHWLASAVALTGIFALMPYIALQLTGMEAVLAQMGLTGKSPLQQALPMAIAFAGVAAFTFGAGLRAPALIAFAKDIMIYIVVIAAVCLLPRHFGGYGAIFHQAAAHYTAQHSGGIVLLPGGYSAYATLALGSALAAFMYPHTITSVLASGGANVIRRNAVLLPAYTFLLGLVALLGIVGAAAGLHLHSSKDVVPALFLIAFPRWFVGFAFAAITVAALVPAAIMSIAAANLFTRNLYREYFRTDATGAQQAQVAKYASVMVNLGALLFVIFLPMSYAVNLQLIGGILILQTFPAIVFGLWRRLFHHHALLLGWAVGMVYSVVLVARLKAQSSVYPVHLGQQTIPVYIGVLALLLNLAVVATATFLLDRLNVQRLPDATSDADFCA